MREERARGGLTPAKRAAILFASMACAFGLATMRPAVAYADTPAELQQRVEQTAADYETAMQHLETVQGEIAENEERIEQIEAELPGKRERAATTIRTQYKMGGGNGLLELLLSSDDFNELLGLMHTLNIIQVRNSAALGELVSAENDLQNARIALESELNEAEVAADDARVAMEAAISAREEAQAAAAAAAAQEQAEALAALQDASSNAGGDFTTSSGNTAQVEVASATEQPANEVSWSERDQFVATWTSRIDAYLAGSPMAGHGRTFAEAAWDYGVDPRWSPAIACIESGKGAYCFKSHNAWGWGSASWGDWDSAIRSHVAGLSAGYGYTISLSAARRYCPPNANAWYSSVLSQMNCI